MPCWGGPCNLQVCYERGSGGQEDAYGFWGREKHVQVWRYKQTLVPRGAASIRRGWGCGLR